MRTTTLGLGHPCCTGVLCAHGRPGVDLDRELRGGGGQLVLRGAPLRALSSVVRRAREAGFERVVVATAAVDRLADAGGADAVRATLFSHVPRVHDRLTGRTGSLAGALTVMRRLRVPIEVEAPLLPMRLSDPRRLVDLAGRSAPVRAYRFFIPTYSVPRAVAPPRLDEIAEAMVEAVAGIEARFDPSQAVPLCAFGDALHDRFDFRKKGGAVRGRAPVEACGGCAVKRACGGPSVSYREAHGDAGLWPFDRWPAGLTGQRASARPRWGPAEREASRHVRFVVLRPTVHCNQGCLFCSANESSQNAFEDPKRMLKAIARVAQRGVRRISFSGGEPTLSPHLPDFVRAASRCGVPEIELVTNGALLDRPGRVEALADAGLTHAFVSLHAHDEALSFAMTQKAGDHAHTLGAIEKLRAANILVAVNHVITARNRAYLSAFVDMLSARLGEGEPKVFLSFAFVTPQYKALEHPELVPRIADTMPYLMCAMRRALELGQPFVVGSRQGIPPCFLGPFAAWSDILGLTTEAASEDAPQKVQGPACVRCRYREICRGLWRPYADRHGFDELEPVEGEPFDEEQIAAIRGLHRKPPWGVPLRFDQASPLLRDRDAEQRPIPEPPPSARASLPVVFERTRPLRLLMVGSGRRAERLAERALSVGGLALAGVASPHAPDARGWWGTTPVFRDVAAAIEAVAPDAVVVAASTDAHAALVAACGGLPVLLEKPVATAQTGRWVSVAIQELFEPGLEELLGARGDVLVRRRCPSSAADAPSAWGRAPLFELLHHLLSIPVVMRGPLREVRGVHHRGASRPTALRATVAMTSGEAVIILDAEADVDSIEVVVGSRRWERRGRDVFLDGVPVAAREGAEERMVASFRDSVTSGAAPPVPLVHGIAIEASARALVDAFEAAGAPLVRSTEPKHFRSRTNPSMDPTR